MKKKVQNEVGMQKKPPKKMGRPKKEIDYYAVEKLANLMCTQDEIASYLGISTRTLQKDEEFLRVFNRGKQSGKMSLRRYQMKLAEKNAQMSIWLGKQYLEQTDKIETQQNVTMSIEDYLKDEGSDL